MSYAKVRVGILVERHDSKWRPFSYSMFHCRSRDRGDAKYCSISDWMNETISCFPYAGELPGVKKIPVGGSRRYWVHLSVERSFDYWGEYDENVEILKVRPCK